MIRSALWIILILAAQSSFSSFAQTVLKTELSLQDNPRLVTQPKQVHGADWLAFSDDNRLLVSTHSTTATAIVWDVKSAREIRRFTRNTNLSGYVQNKFIAATFSPDGERLAVFNVNQSEIRIWNIADGKLLKLIDVGFRDKTVSEALGEDANPYVNVLVFFAFKDGFISLLYRNELQVWDSGSGELVKNEKLEQPLPNPKEVWLSMNLKFGLSWNKKDGFVNESLTIFDPETDKELGSLPIDKFENTAAISLDGRVAATADLFNGVIKIWDVVSRSTTKRLEGYTKKYVKHMFTGEGLFTVDVQEPDTPVAGNPAELAKVSLKNESTGTQFFFDTVFPIDSTISEDGAAVDHSKNLLATMGFKFDGWAGGFRLPVAVADNGTVVATESAGKILISEPGNGRKISEVKLSGGETLHKISPSGSLIVTESFPQKEKEDDPNVRRIKIYDVAKSILKAEFDTYYDGWVTYDVDFAMFSADEKFLAARTDGNLIGIWDLSTKQKINSVKVCNEDGKKGCPAETVNAFSFSPNMQFLAVASGDSDDYQNGRVTISDLKTGSITQTLNIPPFTINALAFSPDSKLLAVGGLDSTIILWDIAANKQTKLLEGHNYQVSNLQFSPDGLFLLSESLDQTARLWNVGSGKEIVQLLSLTNNVWVAVTPEGRFDTDSIEEINGLQWVIPSNPFATLPLDVFMRQYYEPNLLRRVLSCNEENNCDQEFKPLPSIAEINRVQPRVAIKEVKANAAGMADVTVEVESVTENVGISAADRTKKKSATSGVFDVRLFRDGQVVGNSTPDASLEEFIKAAPELLEKTKLTKSLVNTPEDIAWRKANDISTIKAANIKITAPGKTVYTFKNVQLPKDGRKEIEFSAYAFNSDRVKSDTARATHKLEKPVNRDGNTYLITIGVNKSETEEFDLKYAVNDAVKMQEILGERIEARIKGTSSKLIRVPLISDIKDGKTELTATKQILKGVFDLLAGKRAGMDAGLLKQIPNADQIAPIQPEDTLIITFSGHGYADRNGNFYLLPYDIGEVGNGLSMPKLISSDELSLWMRDVTASEMIMIVDACHAAAAVGEDFKPGPMGSRGLGQLAYDKGMKILSATQANNVALELSSLQQGLLSYALLVDGIKLGKADTSEPKDRNLTATEWLKYGEKGVPKLYEEVKSGTRKIFVNDREVRFSEIDPKTRAVLFCEGKDCDKNKTVQQPTLFDFTRREKGIFISLPTT